MKIAVPPGIGDSLWSLMKIPGLLKLSGEDVCDVSICVSSLPAHLAWRSHGFVSRFDFVRSVDLAQLSIVEQRCIEPCGAFAYAPTQPRWHDRFDWLIVVNGDLERGVRIEQTNHPAWGVDWDVMNRARFTPSELRRAAAYEAPMACVYFGPPEGNDLNLPGHNRGRLWSVADWVKVIRLLRQKGHAVLVLGAEYDKGFSNEVLGEWGDRDDLVIDLVGETSIWDALAIIARADVMVSYQSGLAICAAAMGVNTITWWRPYGDSIWHDRFVSFSNDMRHAWAKPSWSHYQPLLYGESPTAHEVLEEML